MNTIQNTDKLRTYSLITPAKLSKRVAGRPYFYGFLRKGDPVYVWGNSGGRYVFSVIKWGNTPKGLVKFSLPVSSFSKDLSGFSSAEGGKKDSTKNKKIIATGATAVAGGVITYHIAKKMGKNGWLFGAVGAIAAGAIGWMASVKYFDEK